MAKNKLSIWAIIILVSTIISLVLLVMGVIGLVAGIPVAQEAARQGAVEGGATADEANAIAAIAIGVIVGVFVLSSVFDILKIIGGFLFSLKGKWGLFCIIVAILGIIGSIISLTTDIKNKAGGFSIAIDGISIAIDALLVVACFKHKAEIA